MPNLAFKSVHTLVRLQSCVVPTLRMRKKLPIVIIFQNKFGIFSKTYSKKVGTYTSSLTHMTNKRKLLYQNKRSRKMHNKTINKEKSFMLTQHNTPSIISDPTSCTYGRNQPENTYQQTTIFLLQKCHEIQILETETRSIGYDITFYLDKMFAFMVALVVFLLASNRLFD